LVFPGSLLAEKCEKLTRVKAVPNRRAIMECGSARVSSRARNWLGEVDAVLDQGWNERGVAI
jgi:hypothetical protein